MTIDELKAKAHKELVDRIAKFEGEYAELFKREAKKALSKKLNKTAMGVSSGIENVSGSEITPPEDTKQELKVNKAEDKMDSQKEDKNAGITRIVEDPHPVKEAKEIKAEGSGGIIDVLKKQGAANLMKKNDMFSTGNAGMEMTEKAEVPMAKPPSGKNMATHTPVSKPAAPMAKAGNSSPAVLHAEDHPQGRYHVEDHGAGVHATYFTAKRKGSKPKIVANAGSMDGAKHAIWRHQMQLKHGPVPAPKGQINVSAIGAHGDAHYRQKEAESVNKSEDMQKARVDEKAYAQGPYSKDEVKRIVRQDRKPGQASGGPAGTIMSNGAQTKPSHEKGVHPVIARTLYGSPKTDNMSPAGMSARIAGKNPDMKGSYTKDAVSRHRGVLNQLKAMHAPNLPKSEDMNKAKIDEGKDLAGKVRLRQARNDRSVAEVRTPTGKQFSSPARAQDRKEALRDRYGKDPVPRRPGEKIVGSRQLPQERMTGVHEHSGDFAPNAPLFEQAPLSAPGGQKSWRTGGDKGTGPGRHEQVMEGLRHMIKPNLPKSEDMNKAKIDEGKPKEAKQAARSDRNVTGLHEPTKSVGEFGVISTRHNEPKPQKGVHTDIHVGGQSMAGYNARKGKDHLDSASKRINQVVNTKKGTKAIKDAKLGHKRVHAEGAKINPTLPKSEDMAKGVMADVAHRESKQMGAPAMAAQPKAAMPSPKQNAGRANAFGAAQAGAFQPKGPINSGLELASPKPMAAKTGLKSPVAAAVAPKPKGMLASIFGKAELEKGKTSYGKINDEKGVHSPVMAGPSGGVSVAGSHVRMANDWKKPAHDKQAKQAHNQVMADAAKIKPNLPKSEDMNKAKIDQGLSDKDKVNVRVARSNTSEPKGVHPTGIDIDGRHGVSRAGEYTRANTYFGDPEPKNPAAVREHRKVIDQLKAMHPPKLPKSEGMEKAKADEGKTDSDKRAARFPRQQGVKSWNEKGVHQSPGVFGDDQYNQKVKDHHPAKKQHEMKMKDNAKIKPNLPKSEVPMDKAEYCSVCKKSECTC